MAECFVLGRDPRWEIVAENLEKRGHIVHRDGMKKGGKAVYLFPFGADEKTLLTLLPHLGKGSLVFVGKASPTLKEKGEKEALFLVPLLEEEAYLAENSRATAEGCVAALIECTPRLLRETKILLCGYGNCGRAIGDLLRSLGCLPTVFTRKGSAMRAEKEGFPLFSPEKWDFDAVINTVPAPIFTPSFLDAIPRGTHLFQIASGTSGLTVEEAEKRGLLFHPLPGLPGIVAYQSEGEILGKLLAEKMAKYYHESE